MNDLEQIDLRPLSVSRDGDGLVVAWEGDGGPCAAAIPKLSTRAASWSRRLAKGSTSKVATLDRGGEWSIAYLADGTLGATDFPRAHQLGERFEELAFTEVSGERVAVGARGDRHMAVFLRSHTEVEWISSYQGWGLAAVELGGQLVVVHARSDGFTVAIVRDGRLQTEVHHSFLRAVRQHQAESEPVQQISLSSNSRAVRVAIRKQSVIIAATIGFDGRLSSPPEAVATSRSAGLGSVVSLWVDDVFGVAYTDEAVGRIQVSGGWKGTRPGPRFRGAFDAYFAVGRFVFTQVEERSDGSILHVVSCKRDGSEEQRFEVEITPPESVVDRRVRHAESLLRTIGREYVVAGYRSSAVSGPGVVPIKVNEEEVRFSLLGEASGYRLGLSAKAPGVKPPKGGFLDWVTGRTPMFDDEVLTRHVSLAFDELRITCEEDRLAASLEFSRAPSLASLREWIAGFVAMLESLRS